MPSNDSLVPQTPLDPPRTAAIHGRVVPFIRPSTAASTPPVPREVASLGQQILLVDDDPGFVQTFGALLQLEGYLVIAALSYAAAIVHINAHTPDVLITDLQLGDADGWELARHARRQQPCLPVLVVTAWPDNVGIDDRGPRIPVFVKPFEPEAVLRHLASVCRPVS